MLISMIIEFSMMLLFLGFSFFFSWSEAAIVGSNPNMLRRMSASGDRRALNAFRLISQRKQFFGTILIGNNIAIVAFTTIGEYMTHSLGDGIISTLIRILIFDGILLIAGEIIPKSLALENPDKNALPISTPVTVLSKYMEPVIRAANYIPSLLIKGMDPEGAVRKLVTEKQFKLAFMQGHQAGIVDDDGKDLGLKVIDFAETTIERVMTLRGDIVALPAEITVQEAFEKIRSHGFSRIPIYQNEDEENVVGFLNVKDLIKAYISNEHGKQICELKRPIPFVPYRKKVLDMMLDFQKGHNHIAMVVDEAGNITGLVTLEDLLEEVVGEIYDEHDEPEDTFQRIGQDTYMVDGRLDVERINDKLAMSLDDEDYETIAGFVMGLFGRVPKEGMSIQHAGAKFTVMKMEGRRIDQIKIKIDRNIHHPQN